MFLSRLCSEGIPWNWGCQQALWGDRPCLGLFSGISGDDSLGMSEKVALSGGTGCAPQRARIKPSQRHAIRSDTIWACRSAGYTEIFFQDIVYNPPHEQMFPHPAKWPNGNYAEPKTQACCSRREAACAPGAYIESRDRESYSERTHDHTPDQGIFCLNWGISGNSVFFQDQSAPSQVVVSL